MSNEPKDGGPAFPQNEFCFDDPGRDGMSLRDWFAGQAIAGIFLHVGWLNTIDGDQDEAARRAYAMADAMLAARSLSA